MQRVTVTNLEYVDIATLEEVAAFRDVAITKVFVSMDRCVLSVDWCARGTVINVPVERARIPPFRRIMLSDRLSACSGIHIINPRDEALVSRILVLADRLCGDSTPAEIKKTITTRDDKEFTIVLTGYDGVRLCELRKFLRVDPFRVTNVRVSFGNTASPCIVVTVVSYEQDTEAFFDQ